MLHQFALLNNKRIFCEGQKGIHYTCPLCDEIVIYADGEQRKYFRHVNKNDCDYYDNSEGYNHKLAKKYLTKMLSTRDIHIIRKCKENKCEHCMDFIIEYNPNSIIVEEQELGNDRKADIGYNVDNELLYVFEIMNKHKTSEFSRNGDYVWFEFSADDIINTFSSPEYTLDCIRYYNCDDCKRKNNINDGVIYKNQRGAGNGKTYESIKLIDRSSEFSANKTTFIYLSKLHSAKQVIYDELKTQYEKGCLTGIIEEIPIEIFGAANKIVKKYKHSLDDKEITVIIGTIDSFVYAISLDTDIQTADYFDGMLENIKQGDIRISDQMINYAGMDIKLDNNCVIIIDEAQDLGENYIIAFNKMLEFCKPDFYVIGDKLQSIWEETNMYTFLENCPDYINVKYDDMPRNIVRRFHNEKFIDIVNKVVPFKDYKLPEISGICDREHCEFDHNDDSDGLTIIEVSNIYSDYESYKDMKQSSINNIINCMRKELCKYPHLLPKDFLFILPKLSKIEFALKLYEELIHFWVKRYHTDSKFREHLHQDKYWDTALIANPNNFVVLHKSEEGKSIDLSISEYQTRIASIHSSKGMGRHTVFVVGLDEDSLCSFSKTSRNLQYESLLHVAITRQKKSLYLCLNTGRQDDIYNRFSNNKLLCNIEKCDFDVIELVNKRVRFNTICDHIKHDDIYPLLRKNIIIEDSMCDEGKSYMDWDHHIIRNAVFVVLWLSNYWKDVINGTPESKAVFNCLYYCVNSNNVVIYDNSRDYNEALYEMKKPENWKNPEYKIIPLLNKNNKNDFSINYIVKCIDVLKNKVKYRDYNSVCPLEAIILIYVMDITKNGIKCSNSIYDIINIILNYSECYKYKCLYEGKQSILHSREYGCICDKYFNVPVEDRLITNYQYKIDPCCTSILFHYSKVKMIKTIYNNFKQSYPNFIDYKYSIVKNISDDDPNYKVRNQLLIHGETQDSIMYFILKPQFNKLNESSIVTEIYTNNAIIGNQRQITPIVITLDHEQPLRFTIIDTEIMDKYYKEAIINHLTTMNGIFIRWLAKKCLGKIPLYIELDEIIRSDDITKPDRIPAYMIEYMKCKIYEIKKCKLTYNHDKLFNIVNNKYELLNDINDYMINELTK